MKIVQRNNKYNLKIASIHWLDKLILLKCPQYTKQYADLIPSLSKCLFFHWTRTNNPKIYIETQNISNIQSDLGKKQKTKTGGITLPDFKLH